MKQTLIILSLLFSIFSVFAQTEKETIETIRTHYKWINSSKDFTIVTLENTDFMEHTTDNGGELKGYFKEDTIYKLVETIGLSNGIYITEYYLWEDKLFFVFYREQAFKEVLDKHGNFMELDYSSTITKFEERFYFDNDKEIRHLEKGERIMAKTSVNYNFSIKKYKALLLNKKEYQSDYKKLKGNWVSTEDKLYTVEFDGLTRTDYYENEVSSQYKIRIEKDNLYCIDLDDKEEYKYTIMSLTDKNLTLMFLPRGNKLIFTKLEGL